MNADEHERRLRDAVLGPDFIHSPECDMRYRGWDFGGRCDCHCAAYVTAYADWLRLRAVADMDCWHPLVETAPGIFRAEQPDNCPPCVAQQQIAEILAAEGGAE